MRARPALELAQARLRAKLAPQRRGRGRPQLEIDPIAVFVQSFPDWRTKVQISTDGGDQALWSAAGKELFYLSQNRSIVSVPVDTRGDFVAQKPQPLFTASIRLSTGAGDSRINYAATPDGKRFLLNTVEQRLAQVPVTVVVD